MSARMSLGQMDRTCATEGHKRSMKVGLVGEMKKLEQVMMMMMSVTPPPPPASLLSLSSVNRFVQLIT